MGINCLLSSLRSIVTRVHISKYKGLKVGIDAHCWIYRGGFSCSKEIVEGIKTTKFIHYFLEVLKLLESEGLIPIVVFDGRPLPAKARTNSTRRETKHQNKTMAREAEADGRDEDAKSLYQRSFSVTPEMVFQLIEELKLLNIEYMVAPYESDAQLAFLSLSKYVDVVITEDSDALVYGCRCVLYKLDPSGYGEEIKRRSLGANEGLSFLNWSDEQFKIMCCLSGCDYAPKIRNVGIVTAHKIVNEHKTLNRIVDALRHSKYEGITDDYIRKLLQALYTFKHQTVYHPVLELMQPLTPLGDSFDWRFGVDYLGEILDPVTSKLLATGEINPITLQPIPRSLPVTHATLFQEAPISTLVINQEDTVEEPHTNVVHRNDDIDSTTIWNSICLMNNDNYLIPSRPDDISLVTFQSSESPNLVEGTQFQPHSHPSFQSQRDMSLKENLTVKDTEKSITNNPSPRLISKYNFQPVTGIEILHRRKKRLSSDLFNVDDEMMTELNPWSSTKSTQLRSTSNIMKVSSPEVSSIHQTLRLAPRLGPSELPIQNINLPTPFDVDHHSRIENQLSSPVIPSTESNRYHNAGIIKYHPTALPSHQFSPFDL